VADPAPMSASTSTIRPSKPTSAKDHAQVDATQPPPAHESGTAPDLAPIRSRFASSRMLDAFIPCSRIHRAAS
jgi:hypothetical protein